MTKKYNEGIKRLKTIKPSDIIVFIHEDVKDSSEEIVIITDACNNFGGFYLGSIGGPAANLGKNCITEVKVKEFEELGMEAIWEIKVKDFPAFIIVDDKGNDFFANL